MTIKPDLDLSLRFLADYVQGGLITVTAIPPADGRTVTCTFPSDRPDELRTFLEKYNGTRNLYFSVNPVRAVMKKKAKKQDIAALAYYHIDCDLRDGFDREKERSRILERLQSTTPRPTYIIDSGNGYQAFWRLDEPIPNEGDYGRLEAGSERLEALLGGDACHNIDRLMRIPGTVNLPAKPKIEKGYKRVLATLVHESSDTVRFEHFEFLPARFVELLQKDKKLKAR